MRSIRFGSRATVARNAPIVPWSIPLVILWVGAVERLGKIEQRQGRFAGLAGRDNPAGGLPGVFVAIVLPGP